MFVHFVQFGAAFSIVWAFQSSHPLDSDLTSQVCF